MKKCPYCGAEYPDDATVCTIDGESLATDAGRKNISGVWRGSYGYDNAKVLAGIAVPFTLVLKKGWVGHFTGTVTEDAPVGMPGTGIIDGYFGYPTIEFTKQMPVGGYMVRPDGSWITYRESFIEHGHACENELPGPVISYEGTFLDANRVQGKWVIKPHRVSLPDGWGFSMPETRGIWCAEFITSDTKATPSGGPKEPFYDKSLLSQMEAATETESSGVPAFRSLGKFNVADAEELLGKFERADLRFEINRDDSPMRQMSPFVASLGGYAGTARMIEIFVHPDDEAKAVEILGDDSKV